MPSAELYLAVLPLVLVPKNVFAGYGRADQYLTLFPNRSLATAFFPEDVDNYIQTFLLAARTYFVGGHVIGYECFKEPTADGRFIVRVVQNVG